LRHSTPAVPLSVFSFDTLKVRVVTVEGTPWFVAADVCRALAFVIQPNGQPNVTVACRTLDGAEKGMYPIQTPGGSQNLRCVSESGLYKLIMRSDKPEAKRFQD
jgi:prophage antirepressor-like protein